MAKYTYTVLLLRPDRTDEAPADWVLRTHVTAKDETEAEIVAAAAAAKTEGNQPDDYSTLATYEGHLFDLHQA